MAFIRVEICPYANRTDKVGNMAHQNFLAWQRRYPHYAAFKVKLSHDKDQINFTFCLVSTDKCKLGYDLSLSNEPILKYKNISKSVQNKLTPKVLKKPVEKILGDDGAKLIAKATIKKNT